MVRTQPLVCDSVFLSARQQLGWLTVCLSLKPTCPLLLLLVQRSTAVQVRSSVRLMQKQQQTNNNNNNKSPVEVVCRAPQLDCLCLSHSVSLSARLTKSLSLSKVKRGEGVGRNHLPSVLSMEGTLTQTLRGGRAERLTVDADALTLR